MKDSSKIVIEGAAERFDVRQSGWRRAAANLGSPSAPPLASVCAGERFAGYDQIFIFREFYRLDKHLVLINNYFIDMY